MYVILALSALLIIGLACLAAYFVKDRQRAREARRQKAIAARLDAIVAQAEQDQRQRKAAARASAAITAVLPAISQGDRAPRRVA